jgi:hypothetical protein
MLADGSLERVKPGHNARLRVDHAYPAQESYVLSIHTLFNLSPSLEGVQGQTPRK